MNRGSEDTAATVGGVVIALAASAGIFAAVVIVLSLIGMGLRALGVL